MSNFSERIWLNRKGSPSTGSVVTYCGEALWKSHKDEYMYFELADCNNKVRLHMSDLDTKKDFIKKMEKLHEALGRFIVFLKSK
jgi:hypothetical protein